MELPSPCALPNKDSAMLPTNILLTSRQVCDEALSVLYRTRTLKLRQTSWSPGNPVKYIYHADSNFARFRKIEFRINTHTPLHQFKYEARVDGEMPDTLGHMLQSYATVPVMLDARGEVVANREIKLKFRLDRYRLDYTHDNNWMYGYNTGS